MDIYYEPSTKGTGKVIVWKNGTIVQNISGIYTYPNYTGYLKMGIYKWNWQKAPTTTTDLTSYMSDIYIYRKAL